MGDFSKIFGGKMKICTCEKIFFSVDSTSGYETIEDDHPAVQHQPQHSDPANRNERHGKNPSSKHHHYSVVDELKEVNHPPNLSSEVYTLADTYNGGKASL